MKARLARPIDGFDAKTKAAVIRAATEEFDKQKKDFLDMVFDIMLWTLHVELGFGRKRLKRFYKAMFANCYVTRERYELIGCEKSHRPMSEKIRAKEAENGWTYPEWVKDQLGKIGWDTDAIEKEFYDEYMREGKQI
jgi:hypothetical protein